MASGESALKNALILLVVFASFVSLIPLNLIPEAKATSGFSTVLITNNGYEIQPMNYPHAIYDASGNATYFAYQVPEAGVKSRTYFRAYNHTTNTLTSAVELWTQAGGASADGHYAASIAIMWNGSIIVMGNTHSYIPGHMDYRISKGAHNPNAFYAVQSFVGDWTYPQAISYSNETKVFIRKSLATHDIDWRMYTLNSTGLFLGGNIIITNASVTVDQGGMYAMFNTDTNGYIYMSGALYNYTADPVSNDWRGNLYFAYSKDRGKTWKMANNTALTLPLGFVTTKISTETPGTNIISISTTYTSVGTDNKPRIMATRGRFKTTDYWTGLRYGIWNGTAWNVGWVKDEHGAVLNMTQPGLYGAGGHPTAYGVAQFRDQDFNRTTFWWTHRTTRKLTRYVATDNEADYTFIRTTQTTIEADYAYGMVTANHVDPFEAYASVVDSDGTKSWYYIKNDATYLYTLKGLYDEDTGLIKSMSQRAVNVTAYFSDGTDSEMFEVNGTYYYGASSKPTYFLLNTSKTREYWTGTEETSATIYIFDTSLTTYTISFLDLAGAFKTYEYVAAQRYINGTLTTVEKRKVDVDNKIVMNLKNGVRYTIIIANGVGYTFGDLVLTSTTSFQLTLKGLEFPDNIKLAYKWVRMYADRHNNQTSISMVYQDTLASTTRVNSSVYFENGTIAYSNLQTGVNSFNVTWTSAQYNTSYYVVMVSTHPTFGELEYRTTLPRAYSTAPWGLAFLGTLPGSVDTSVLVPVFIILCAMGVFSQKNAYVGMFVGACVTGLFVWIGWLSVASFSWSMIFTALLLTILYALGRKRRHETP